MERTRASARLHGADGRAGACRATVSGCLACGSYLRLRGRGGRAGSRLGGCRVTSVARKPQGC